MKTIYIIDVKHQGHHPTFFKHFVWALLNLDFEVMAFFPKPAIVENWLKQNCSEQKEAYHLFEAEIVGSEKKRSSLRYKSLMNWKSVAASIKTGITKTKKKPDFVFLAQVDDFRFKKDHPLLEKLFLKRAHKLVNYPWSGLYSHPTHFRGIDPNKQWADFDIDNIFKLPNCINVGVTDEGVASAFSAKIGKKVIPFPEITDGSAIEGNTRLAQKIKDVALGKPIIGLLGMQNKRKGLLTMLRTAKLTEEVNKPYYFLFAGPLQLETFSEKEQQEINGYLKTLSNCYFHFKSIPDGEAFNGVLKICDIQFAVYLNFPHSSNIQTKAAIFEQPIISGEQFLMGERNRNYKFGPCIKEDNPVQALAAIDHVVNGVYNEKAKFKAFVSAHHINALIPTFEKIINNK